MNDARYGLQFLSVKAFGDFVIAATSLERAAPEDRARLSILAGDHLRPLAEAVSPACGLTFLGSGISGVPAIFDTRRAGARAAIRSATMLRRAVRQARDRSTTLVLDKNGWRERWLATPQGALALPTARNIYAAYDAFLAAAGIVFEGSVSAKGGAMVDAVVGLFPGSRVAAKNLPFHVVRAALAAIARSGKHARLFLLEGERPDLEHSDLPFEMVPRRFEALIAAVDSVGSVIGADSLPAHLAERAGRPVFVLSPRPNIFWLPRSSLAHDHWAVFDADLDLSLARFLDVK
ncbi:hypothetical protein [uncultured Sphingomonas sp.]|mgnify:CR=1 FL=1|uniref:hypothetical protein n=1 Tax=uncultured Sphingomonas sp. TaxID=158754 RepID=UPI00262EEF2E|nr:hypothetical protein [uncultured Sphingomonas sp.]